MPTKITTLTVNELGQASASKAAAAAAEASATAAAASAAAALAAENSLLEWQGPWVTATAYAPSDLVEENGNTYVCLSPHTSGTFSTDLGNSLWELFAAKGDTGPGSGDLLAANNLSDLASIPTARANLGISTFGATLIDDTDAAAARTTLGVSAVVSGTHTCTATPVTSGTVTLQPLKDAIAYVRIGKVVFLRGMIQVATADAPVGLIDISLPFSVEALPEGTGFHFGTRYDTSAAAYIQDPIAFIEGSAVLRWNNTPAWGVGDQIIINDFYFTDAA